MNSQVSKGLDEFRELFLTFKIDSIDEATGNLIRTGTAPHDILNECRRCMEKVGVKFEEGEYFLPELLMAGEIFKKVCAQVEPLIVKDGAANAGKILLGTPKGDMHNLGKDIFGILAKGSGFEIIDLGVDVPPKKFIDKLQETGAQILGMSVLITTAFDSIKEVMRLLEESGLKDKVRVIIGGGVTTPEMAKRLNIDAQTSDAYEGVRIVQSFMAQIEEE